MWVILKEPIKGLGIETLAFHTDTFNAIILTEGNGTFELSIQKHYDGLFSRVSSIYYTLGIFDTRHKCMDFFQELIDALNDGKKVFELQKSFAPNVDREANKFQKTGYL